MGYESSSFNVREEMGKESFLRTGRTSIVRKFDPHAVHDWWLEDTDEKEIRKRGESSNKEKMKMEKQEAEEKVGEEWEAGHRGTAIDQAQERRNGGSFHTPCRRSTSHYV